MRRNHAVEGNTLLGFRTADNEAFVFGGEEALGHDGAEPAGGKEQENGEQQRQETMTQHHGQRSVIGIREPVESPLHDAVETFIADAMLSLRLEEVGAQHGRQREGHHTGEQDGGDDDHGEFIE